jgi:hypothetical protein
LALKARGEELAIEPIYFSCPPIPSAKAPLSLFFANLLRAIPYGTVQRFVRAFKMKSESDKTLPSRVLAVLNGDSAIYEAIVEGLSIGNDRSVRAILGWLGGEVSEQMASQYAVAKQITEEGQLARNVGALGEILLLAEGKNLIFLIDEAERFQSILSGEHYWAWLSAMREVFRRPSIGLILFIIARNRDDIPQILWEEEITSVIGNNNIRESPPFAQPHAESFLNELLEAVIQRNPCPDSLKAILEKQGESLKTYPFTQKAYDAFVAQHSIGTSTNNPRAMINSLERCARRAMTLDKKFIDKEVLQQVIEGI